VLDPRILAVRADPPEALFDWDRPPPSVHVAVLIAPPLYGDNIVLTGMVCPPTADGRCPPGSQEIPQTEGPGETLQLEVQPDTGLLAASRDQDPLHGFGGIRVQLDLAMSTDSGHTGSATKLLVYSPAVPGYVPNHSFEVSGVELWWNGAAVGTYATGSDAQLVIPNKYGVTPLLTPGPGATEAAEEYFTTDYNGNRVVLHEHITYSFFTAAHGQFNLDAAVEPPLGTPVDPNGLVLFRPTSPAHSHIYVVARDGRGGEAWGSFDFDALDPHVSITQTQVAICGVPTDEMALQPF
jgi:hypothetical protein